VQGIVQAHEKVVFRIVFHEKGAEMKKIVIISGCVFLFFGMIIFTIGLGLADWTFENLATEVLVQKSAVLSAAETQTIRKIDGDLDVGEFRVVFTDKEEYSIEYQESDRLTLSTTIKNDTLFIMQEHSWFPLNLFDFTSHKIKTVLFLPKKAFDFDIELENGNINFSDGANEYGNIAFDVENGAVTLSNITAADVDIEMGNGSCDLNNLSANKLEVKSANGVFDISRVNAKSLQAETNNGDIKINDLTAEQAVVVKGDNGRIDATRISAQSVSLVLSNGDIKTQNITSERLNIKTSNGHINADKSDCQIITLASQNGDIEGSFAGDEKDYTKTFVTRLGRINPTYSPSVGTKTIEAKTTNGDIGIHFYAAS
jgi:DUF4097 and DUF4098 domain-containing protein YvlB